jgi:hypothetical protein
VGRVRGRPFAKGLSLAGVLPGSGAAVVGKMAGCPASGGRDIPTSSELSRTQYSSQIDANSKIRRKCWIAEVAGKMRCLVVWSGAVRSARTRSRGPERLHVLCSSSPQQQQSRICIEASSPLSVLELLQTQSSLDDRWKLRISPVGK